MTLGPSQCDHLCNPHPHPPSNCLFFVGILATTGSNSDGPTHFVSAVWTGHSDHPSLTTTSSFTSTILSRLHTITRKKCLILLDLEARKSSLLPTCSAVSLCPPKSLTCWVCLHVNRIISLLPYLSRVTVEVSGRAGAKDASAVHVEVYCAWRNSLQWYCVIKILHGGWLGWAWGWRGGSRTCTKCFIAKVLYCLTLMRAGWVESCRCILYML